jgi:hypothetical protein
MKFWKRRALRPRAHVIRGNPAGGRPPAGYVLTPGGFRPAAMVRSLPSGAVAVSRPNGIRLVDTKGRHLKGPTLPRYQIASPGIIPNDGGLGNLNPAWVASFLWQKPVGNPPIQNFQADWQVPTAPMGGVGNGQTVFLFLSLMNADMTEIIQPVLQFGNPFDPNGWGGELWLLRSWFIGPTEGAIQQPGSPLSVAPGTNFSSAISVEASGGTYACTASFIGTGGVHFPQLELKTTFIGEPVRASITLETYCMASREDYPPTDPLQFTGISIIDQSGADVMSGWTTDIQNPIGGCADGGMCPRFCSSAGSTVRFHLCQ